MPFATAKEAFESDEGKTLINDMIEAQVKGLKTKNGELLGKVKELGDLKTQMDELKEAKDKAEEEALKKAGDSEALEKKIEARFKSQLENSKTEAEKLKAQLNEHVVGEGLTNALVKAGVATEFMGAATALIKSSHRVEIGDNDGKPFAKLDGEAVNDFVAGWAKSDAGKHFVKAPNNNGGGSNGANGGGEANVAKKQMARSEFDNLSPMEKTKFSKEGGQLID